MSTRNTLLSLGVSLHTLGIILIGWSFQSNDRVAWPVISVGVIATVAGLRLAISTATVRTVGVNQAYCNHCHFHTTDVHEMIEHVNTVHADV